MRSSPNLHATVLTLTCLATSSLGCVGKATAPPSVDESSRLVLVGNTRHLPRGGLDLGPIDPLFPMAHLQLVLMRSRQLEGDLESLVIVDVELDE